MRPRGKRALLTVALVCAAAGAVDVATGDEADVSRAVARALPSGYRLVLTQESGHGTVHVARYGKPLIEPGDAPLSVTSLRGGAPPGPAAGAGGQAATA